MAWFKYTSDAGDVYAINLDKSNATALGFDAAEATDPKIPSGLIPRHVNMKSTTTVRGRSIPVKAADDDFWNGTTTSASLNVGGAATETFNTMSYIGEKRTRQVNPTDTGLTT